MSGSLHWKGWKYIKKIITIDNFYIRHTILKQCECAEWVKKICWTWKNWGSKNLMWKQCELLFDADDTTHQELLSEGQTVTAACQRDIMGWLLKGMNWVRSTMYASNIWFFMHGNESSHNTVTVKQFSTNRKVVVLHHPTYLPEFTPAEYFPFPKIKLALKGLLFESIMEIHDKIARELKKILKKALLEGIKNCMRLQISVQIYKECTGNDNF